MTDKKQFEIPREVIKQLDDGPMPQFPTNAVKEIRNFLIQLLDCNEKLTSQDITVNDYCDIKNLRFLIIATMEALQKRDYWKNWENRK
jgi:hypothetical protein